MRVCACAWAAAFQGDRVSPFMCVPAHWSSSVWSLRVHVRPRRACMREHGAALSCAASTGIRGYEGTRVRERWSDLQATTATRPIAVTGFGDDTDDEEEDGNSLGAKRVLARLGVAMARSNRSRRSPHAHCTPASSACVHLHTQRC
jgi:hypothetical protein